MFFLDWLSVVITSAIVLTCFHKGFPFKWMRENGYMKYRIIHTTKYGPEGLYILQQSYFGLFWEEAKIDDYDFYEDLFLQDGEIENEKLDRVKIAKDIFEARAKELKQEHKRTKVTKVIE